MKNLKAYETITKIFITLLILYLVIYGKAIMFIYSYILVYLLITFRSFLIPSSKIKIRIFLIILYTTTLIIQVSFANISIVNYENLSTSALFIKSFASLVLLFPFIIERSTIIRDNKLSIPSFEDVISISYSDLLKSKDKVISILSTINKTSKTFSIKKIYEVLAKDFPRNNSFKYINKGVLTDEYFDEVKKTFNDSYIYIIISNTGSIISEMISTFTNKSYNHASISFDKDLKTIISYNGGQRVMPPGLNREMLEHFNKKDDASIIVYRLKCTKKQKQTIMNKIKEINEEGSAYNVLGLLLRRSYRPNIMVCSHFVYKMLLIADLKYFDKKENLVTPTDLVELDYTRKLEFIYELKLNKKDEN